MKAVAAGSLFLLLAVAIIGVLISSNDSNSDVYFRRRSVTDANTGNRKLTRVKSYGGSPSDSRLPLGECEGDCDPYNDVRMLLRKFALFGMISH